VRLVVLTRADGGLAFSVNLTRDEWRAFAPPQVAPGERWSLPESVARNFAPVLSPYADTRFRPRPGDLTAAELTAEVEAVEKGLARVRLAGRWHADWTHDDGEHSIGSATAQGIAVYDVNAKAIRSLLMVFDGTYSYTTTRGAQPRPRTSAAVVRWRLDGEAE
jgi:hypothetical protein